MSEGSPLDHSQTPSVRDVLENSRVMDMLLVKLQECPWLNIMATITASQHLITCALMTPVLPLLTMLRAVM